MLRTFGYTGSIAAAAIAGIAFRARGSDPGLPAVAAVLAGVGIVVLDVTILDRHPGTAPGSRPHCRRNDAAPVEK